MRWAVRRILVAALAVACVGIQLGVGEILHLHDGGFSLGLPDVGQILLAHAVLGLAIGGVFVLAIPLLSAGARALGLPPASYWDRVLAAGPALAAAFVLGGLVLNIVWLPKRLDPLSLAADAALFLGIVAVGLVWAARPWSARGDRVAFRAWAAVNAGLVGFAFVSTALDRPPPTLAAKAAPAGAPNLVIVLFDTLRADHLGVYGYERNTSPHIDALAREGQVFDRAFSSSNWTRPALASLHTSTQPIRHQMIDIDRGVPSGLTLLSEALQSQGYFTAMVTVGANFEPADGYDRSVDRFYVARLGAVLNRTTVFQSFVFRDFPWTRAILPGGGEGEDPTRPENITERALEFVHEADPAKPLLLFVHYLGPHDPYAAPPPYDQLFGDRGVDPRLTHPPNDQWAGSDAFSPEDRQQMLDQYDEKIVWHDDSLGRLLDGLRAAGRLDDGVVVVMSDHGEGFGEHGMWSHNAGLFKEVTRIPLIVWSSHSFGGPQRHPQPASLIDVAPTFVELAGAPMPETFDGRSLLPRLRGEETGKGRVVFQQNPLNGERGMRSEEWTYFEEDRFGRKRQWLYRADDWKQELDLVREHPEVVTAAVESIDASARLDEARRHEGPRIELDQARKEQLQALGYIE